MIGSATSAVTSGTRAVSRTRPGAPLRVALVISNLEFGGAQRQVVELANNFDRERVAASIYSLSSYVPLSSSLHDSDRILHVVPKRFKYDLSVVPRLARLFTRDRIEIAQSFLFDADIAVRLAGRIAPTSLVVNSERNTDYQLKPQQALAYRLTFRMVDLIIANSHAGAAFNQGLLGHDAATYRVVHNGVDTRRFRPMPSDEARRRLGLDSKVRVIGMFASFKQQKNHPMFLTAARQVLDRYPEARLLLVGDELHGGMHGSREYKHQIEGLLDQLRLRDSCLCVGNRDDVEWLYPACDMTVLPSLFEGTPNVALESMACGVPIIVTDVADNRLIVPDGRVGYVVPVGDHALLANRMIAILEDLSLATRLGHQAVAWIEEQFSTRRLAEKTESVYREALARQDTP